MRQIKTLFLAAAVALGLAAAAHGQGLAKVQGKCVGDDGKPVVGATVLLLSEDTGQKISLKTDKKGEYFTIGIQPGTYKVSLVQDGKELFFLNHVPVHLTPDDSPVQVDLDLPKERAKTAGGSNMSEEQKKQYAEAQKKNTEIEKENAKIVGLNQKLQQARDAETAGNWDQAVSILTEATQTAPDKALLWANLGGAALGGGEATKDKQASAAYYERAIAAYKKALELEPANPNIGSIHNNLGQAYAKSGKPQEALAEYTAAAQADPKSAATYYFNLGAILTNQATFEQDASIKAKDIDEANAAFDKAIAAKPDYSEAWYQKALNLISKATYDKSGKIIPAPGTVEALNKYLEIDPTGKHAGDAKGLLTGLGETVQVNYKKAKSK